MSVASAHHPYVGDLFNRIRTPQTLSTHRSNSLAGHSWYVSHGRSPAIKGIFAIIALVEFTLDPFLSPNLTPCSFRVYSKVFVPLSVITVDRVLRRLNGTIVTVVYDSPCHSAEHGFDHIEELRPRGQWGGFYNRISFDQSFIIPPFNVLEELFGNVPRRCVPRKIDGLTVAILGPQQIHHLDHLLGVLLV